MRSPCPNPLWISLLLCVGISFSTCTYDYTVLHETLCNDGVDNNGNGLVDCEDPDCADSVHCLPEDCNDGVDNNGNGLVDCEDPYCRLNPICLGPRPCTNDGVCDPFEDCFWCDDCCPQCSLDAGQNADYIATEVVIPRTAAEGNTIGIDLDNDGQIDNSLGAIMGLFGENTGEQTNQSMNRSLQNGIYILLTRLVVDDLPTDPEMAFQMFPGLADPTLDATEDNFTGNGHALIDMAADRTAHLCGSLLEGALTTGPRRFVMPIGLMGGIVYLQLERGQARSPGGITAEEIPELHIGGGMTRQTVNNQLLPFMAVRLNDQIRRDPSDDLSQMALGYVDANCNSTIPGCTDVQNNAGECVRWNGDPETPPISVTELRCNLFFHTALQPDVDTDGDGVKDLLSVGMRLRAIHITIDN